MRPGIFVIRDFFMDMNLKDGGGVWDWGFFLSGILFMDINLKCGGGIQVPLSVGPNVRVRRPKC